MSIAHLLSLSIRYFSPMIVDVVQKIQQKQEKVERVRNDDDAGGLTL